MTHKPLLLIDIDGVLLPFGGKLANDAELIELPWGQSVAASPSMRGRLAKLREDFEFHWASMWQEMANEIVGPWHSLPQLPYIKFVAFGPDDEFSYENDLIGTFIQSSAGRTYKLPSIKDYVGDRPFAWVDDHIFADAFEWMRERNKAGIPTCLVNTDPRVGLTDSDVDYLLRFSEAVRRYEKIGEG